MADPRIGKDVNDNVVIKEGGVVPEVDNNKDLGTSSKYWKDLYIKGSLKSASNSVTVDDLAAISTPVAADVEVEKLGTPTYDDLQDWLNNTQSSGYIVGGDITATDPPDGTVAISAVKGFIKTTDSDIGVTKFFDLAGVTNFVLTNNSINYIYVDYNAGSPQFAVTTDRTTIELNRHFEIGKVYREDNTLHILQSGVKLPNFLRNEHERLISVRGFERGSGGVISESGTRYLHSTGGEFYLGVNKITTTGKDTSGADTFTRHYHSGGTWTSDEKSQIAEGDVYQYDNGTNLTNLSNNKYGVWWVYIDYDSHLHVVVGRGDYTLLEAQTALLPDVPDFVSEFAKLAAKIILKEGETNFTAVVSAYETLFPMSGEFNHNDLGGIQGGAADDYYHLTQAQHAEALLFSQTGWIPAGETWTYASADDPTFTFTISGDKTSKYSAGMRIKLTQTTVKYFIITKVAYSSPNTTITVYGGTDYDLADAVITLPYYSTQKAPQGFPLDPDKWTIEVIDTTAREQASPTQNTWYNLGGISINIPIGAFRVGYTCTMYGYATSADAVRYAVTLSTANNSESDSEFTAFGGIYTSTNETKGNYLPVCIEKSINLSSKTTYYLNMRTIDSGLTKIQLLNSTQPLIIRAICAYL